MEGAGKDCNARGASGERGCFQFMKATWEGWSKKVLGYVAEQTPKTEYYVALRKIQFHLDQGYSDSEVAKIWNQGHAGQCSSGINKLGVPYDSCAYEQKFRLAMR